MGRASRYSPEVRERAVRMVLEHTTELIWRKGPWRNVEHVEFGTLDWVDWFNHRRLLEPIGYVPPAEHEEEYNRSQQTPVAVAGLR